MQFLYKILPGTTLVASLFTCEDEQEGELQESCRRSWKRRGFTLSEAPNIKEFVWGTQVLDPPCNDSKKGKETDVLRGFFPRKFFFDITFALIGRIPP